MRIPEHVGIIPDGNRRWAVRSGLQKADGYRHGLAPGLALLHLARESGIRELSYYGFTTDNTRRPSVQVEAFSRACVEAVGMIAREPCSLLVVGGPDHGHHNAEENAQCQRHGRDQQGGADAVQVLLPAASFDKCLIEFDVEFLPEGCGAVPHQGFPKFVKFHSFTFSFNIARYRVIRRKSAFPARRSVFRVQPCQGRLEPPLAKRLDYSAEMYLSTMD